EVACAVRENDAVGYFDSVIAVRVKNGTERSLTSRRWAAVGQIAWLSSDAGLVISARESPAAPFQIWQISKSGDDVRLTNDLNDYRNVTFNANTGSLLAVQTNVVSSVWIMPYSSDLVSHR